LREREGRIRTVLAGEKRLATKHLRKNTSNGPDVDSLGVFLEGKHDLGGTVPARGNVFGHEARVILLRGGGSSEAEVAHFKIAVGIQKKVGRFQVAVEDVGRMHGLESAEGLVDEVLAMVVGEILGANDSVHVRFHEFLQRQGREYG
jgi:hypothetical protein